MGRTAKRLGDGASPPSQRDGGTVELRGVSKLYEGVPAVDGVSLTVQQGEFLTLLGPSGCGKSTTLNMVAGFTQPSAGTVLLDGKDVTHRPPQKRDTSMVFQDYALFPHMTVRENVGFGLRTRRVPKADIDRRVGESLTLVGLHEHSDRYPAQLSGGQQQRVALARAIVVEPAALLLDEPLSNLDLKLREELRVEIRHLQRRLGITTIFVTHDQVEALSVSDRIVVMNAGRIEQVGRPDEIYTAPATAFVAGFIGQSNLLPGTVHKLQPDDRAVVQLESGATLLAMDPLQAGQPGETVTVLCRPESLQVALGRRTHEPPATSEQANSFHGKVAEVVYLGSVTSVTVDVPGVGQIAAEVPPATATQLSPGAEVTVAVAAVDCLALQPGPQA